MKGDRLGEFEELTLLALKALDKPSYAVPVQAFVEREAGRDVSMGAVYAALGRLETKGFLLSVVGEPSPVRGGKRKRLLVVTPSGISTLRELRGVRDRIWRTIDARRRS